MLLEQDNHTITEYELEFSRLGRFASKLVESKLERARKIEKRPRQTSCS